MKNIKIILSNAVYCNFLLLIVCIGMIIVYGMHGITPVATIFFGICLVLWLFESAMNYDEFKCNYEKLVEINDTAEDAWLNDVQVKKDGKWL